VTKLDDTLTGGAATTELRDDVGKAWRIRLDAAEKDHQRASARWEYHRALYLTSLAGFKEAEGWTDKIAYAWAVVHGMIDDTYFQNPEDQLTARGGDPDGTMAKEIMDVLNTVHADADTEGVVRQAMETASSFAGFAVHWAYFEQIDHSTGDVHSQRVLGEYVSPFHFRRDPAGRRWDLKDHKWISRRYKLSLEDALSNPLFTDEGKAKLKTWAKGQHFQDPSIDGTPGELEEDPGFHDVWFDEIWSRPGGFQIVHMPVGAEFVVSPPDNNWPIEFIEANDFPATLIAFNRVPEDRKGIEGWWPLSDVALIEDQLAELNRLNGILMEAATLSTLKYLYVKGLIGEDVMTAIESDKTRTMTPVDITKVREHLVSAGYANAQQFSLRDLIMLLPQEERAAMVKHEEAIERVLNNIAEVLGQGPNARYGLAPAKTATESAGLQAAKDQRTKARARMAGRVYDAISAKFWLLLKAHQQLPIDYVYSTDGDAGVWRQFSMSKARNIDLAFRHRVGSSRPHDTQGEILALQQASSVGLPILMQAGQTDAALEVVTQLFYLLGFKNLAVFKSPAKQIAQQLAMLRFTAMRGQPGDPDPTDPNVAHQNAELITQLLQAVLGPQGMQQVAAQIAGSSQAEPAAAGGSGGGGPDQSGGSLPKPPTVGEQAFRAGAAGAGRSVVG
jgi:hypothetical protein